MTLMSEQAHNSDQTSPILQLDNEAQVQARIVGLAAVSEIADPALIGDEAGVEVLDARTFTLWFHSLDRAYLGWYWAATVTQVADDAPVTVLEVGQVPGPEALTAPEWVPWSIRLKKYREAKAREEAVEAEAAKAAAEELAEEDDAEDDLLDNDFSDFDEDFDGVDFESDDSDDDGDDDNEESEDGDADTADDDWDYDDDAQADDEYSSEEEE
jgi:hypothetical protein